MAEVGIADIALDFYPLHPVAIVHQIFDHVIFDRKGKRGPTCAAVKFFAGIEQWGTAANTGVKPRFVAFTILPAEWSLRAMLPGDAKLFGA